MTSEVASAVDRYLTEECPDATAGFVYGSVATGKARPGSDVDCFVLLARQPSAAETERLRSGFVRLQEQLATRRTWSIP